MAYQTGTANTQEDLMNALSVFAAANGWTVDIMSTTNDWLALNNTTVYVQFRWDNAASGGGIAMFQSLGFTGTGTAPGNQTGDSGIGLIDASTPYNAAVSSQRRITITNGPYTAYHFFTDGTTKYIHCVVEYSPGLYRHFGFGTLDKKNNWTGGEYSYAHRWSTGTNSDNPISFGTSTTLNGGHNVMFDSAGGASTASDANEAGCVMHVESLTGQTAGSKWGLFLSQSTTLGNDRAGNARINLRGGARGGGYLAQLGFMRANLLNGYIPLIPIPTWWMTGSSPVQTMLLGFAPDIRVVNIGNIVPGAEFTVGPDTWKVFPWVRKQFLQADTEESWNGGWAYRKVP